MIRAQSVEVDILQQSSIKAHYVVIAHCDKCRKVMLRRGTVRAQFVGVDAHCQE